MLDFQQKRKLRGFMYHRITLFVLGFLVVSSLYSTFGVWQKKKESEEFRKVAEKKLSELQNRHDNLEKDIERLETPEGVEEEIRSKFSVAKKGENVVVIVNDIAVDGSSSTEKVSFWQKFLNLFK